MYKSVYEHYFYRGIRFLQRSAGHLFHATIPLMAEYAVSSEPVPWQKRGQLTYRPVTEGEIWGKAWDSAWFRMHAVIPEEWGGKRLALVLNLSGESLLFDAKGVPLYAFSSGSLLSPDFVKEIFRLPEPRQGGELVEFEVEAAANTLFGLDMDHDPKLNCPKPRGDFRAEVRQMRLAWFNPEVEQLRIEFRVLIELAAAIGFPDYRAVRIVQTLNDCVAKYQENPDHAAAAREILQSLLKLPALGSALHTTAIGHAHLDIGWLWPVRETIRKAARTFANQVELMEKYPDYVFGASQPQVYAFVKEHYPCLYEKVKKLVAAGRWELLGGMWVEADTNLISGESMIRQFLHGKNFFRDEFGIDVKELWLPDVFGYSAALPQIMLKSGCDSFLTQKISWSQINKFPYSTFFWKGIDGSRVLTHFPPEDTYNSLLLPKGLVMAQNNLNENNFQQEFMTLFGVGDGGGGPTCEMIETGKVVADLEGCPRVKFGRADQFFARIHDCYQKQLPEWSGELYLEVHRGTLTTQGAIKRLNRQLEERLACTEFICSAQPLEFYPEKELDSIWKTMLCNQFHDILPGSSIQEVYQVSEAEYSRGLAVCGQFMTDAVRRIGLADENALTLVNSLPGVCAEPVKLPKNWNGFTVTGPDGQTVSLQREDDGTVWMFPVLPGSSSAVFRRGMPSNDIPEPVMEEEPVLENERIRYRFDTNGELLSAFDLECGFELLSAPGNRMKLYHDHPNNWDAWDFDFFYPGDFLENARMTGPVRRFRNRWRSWLEFELTIGDSTVHQRVELLHDSKRLDFRSRVNWRESRKMLRVEFPTRFPAENETFDIQYGYLKRPTHQNTSWDFARFEVCGRRYADLSVGDYGIALMNDCKYGYRPSPGILDLCLLRSPKFPDWNTDCREHEFTYSFYPHAVGFEDSDVIDTAAALNRPPTLFPGIDASVMPPCRVEGSSLRLEVVKKAEKSAERVIRIVEILGRPGTGKLRLTPGLNVKETCLMEWNDSSGFLQPDAEGAIPLHLHPFEIMTLKLFPSKERTPMEG